MQDAQSIINEVIKIQEEEEEVVKYRLKTGWYNERVNIEN
jgi:hypothetical protein